MSCCHYVVSGRVQGVGFRRFVELRAGKLGINGWVRNLKNGKVEILAFAESEKLQIFEKQIAQGPALAKVQDVHKTDMALEQLPKKFDSFKSTEHVFVTHDNGDKELDWLETKT